MTAAENGTKRPAEEALKEPAAKKLATDKTAPASSESSTSSPALEDITFEITIAAPPQKVYEILTTAAKFKEATSLNSNFSLTANGMGVFSVHRHSEAPTVFGRFVHVVKDKLIIQEFRAANYDTNAPDSTVTFHLSPRENATLSTSISFALLQVPKQCKSDLENYWKNDVLGKIKSFVGDESKLRTGSNICHLEIMADDLDRASKFYGAVFDWNIAKWGEYYGYNSGPKESQNGWVDGGFTKREAGTAPSASGFVPYYACDVAAYEKKVLAAGGKVVKPLTKEYYGTVSQCLDTEGNKFVLYER